MTRQPSDFLYFKNKKYSIDFEILADYFIKYPDKYFKPQFSNTSLWRGYVAIFIIRKGQLFVKKIKLLSLNSTFEKLTEFNYESYCDWYTGLIRIDEYKMDFMSEKNKDAIFEYLEIRQGHFVKHHILNFKEFRKFKASHFSQYKDSPKYKKDLNMFLNAGMSLKESKSILSDYFLDNYKFGE